MPVSIQNTGYWTGIAINNQSNLHNAFKLSVYNDVGELIASKGCVSVHAKGIKTDLLENFFQEAVSGRMSLYIETNSAWSERFEVTIFMGNTGNKNPGFTFQTYRSESFSKTDTTVCIIKF